MQTSFIMIDPPGSWWRSGGGASRELFHGSLHASSYWVCGLVLAWWVLESHHQSPVFSPHHHLSAASTRSLPSNRSRGVWGRRGRSEVTNSVTAVWGCERWMLSVTRCMVILGKRSWRTTLMSIFQKILQSVQGVSCLWIPLNSPPFSTTFTKKKKS